MDEAREILPSLHVLPGESFAQSMQRSVSALLIERSLRVENAIRAHVESHSVEDVVRKIAEQQDEIAFLTRRLERSAPSVDASDWRE